jgi:imidazolonepropionase-like amidohydrolase
LLGLGSEVGSLVPGRQADLLVVDGDPLADLRHLLRIERVIVGGRVYESPVTP